LTEKIDKCKKRSYGRESDEIKIGAGKENKTLPLLDGLTIREMSEQCLSLVRVILQKHLTRKTIRSRYRGLNRTQGERGACASLSNTRREHVPRRKK